MNKEFNEENNISEEELTRVSKALNAIENHSNQPTQSEWNLIMEKSKAATRKQMMQTKILSIAAVIALVVMVGGIIFALTNSNDSSKINTVDNKKKEAVKTSTTTTTPLTDEQRLLQNTVILTREITQVPSGNTIQDSTLVMSEGLTGKTIDKFTPFIKGIYDPLISYAGGNNIAITAGASPSCDPTGLSYYNTKTNITSNVSGKAGVGRFFSPSGNKYAEFQPTCYEYVNNRLDSTVMTIVDTKTGSKRVIKPEPWKDAVDEDGIVIPDASVSAVGIHWIDENQFLLSTSINTANGINITLESLDKTISLTNAVKKDSIAPSSSDGDIYTSDVKIVDGKIYLLIVESALDKNKSQLKVQELKSGKVIYTKKITDINLAIFGNSIDTIYGSLSDYSDQNYTKTKSFIYDHKLDKVYNPGGDAIFPIL